jgi:hypothetical protein
MTPDAYSTGSGQQWYIRKVSTCIARKATAMDFDVNTFLTTLYTTIDEWYQAEIAASKPVRPGPKPSVSESEVLTITVLAQWQQNRSERAFLRLVARQWQGYFRRQLSQSAFNRRVRDLAGVLCRLGPALEQVVDLLLGGSAYAVVDGVPVPLMRRCRGERHRLFGAEAGIGRGGSDKEWYYGVKLLTVVDAHGLISGFVLAPASTEEHWLLEAALRWRQDPTAPQPTAADLAEALGPSHSRGGQRTGPTGPVGPRLGVGQPSTVPYLGDLGYTGARWVAHWWAAYGAQVLTKADYVAVPDEAARQAARSWFSGLRQVVETINNLLSEQLGLKYPRARSRWGLFARIAAKVAACNFTIFFNHLHGRPLFSQVSPLG